jgi:FtsH-binding integral membrane protein
LKSRKDGIAMELTSTQRVILRIGGVIASCTLLLTASFIGLIAAFSGDIQGFDSRVPWYIVVAAIMFVAVIVLLELNDADGKTIIVSAAFSGVISFILVFFSIEGLIFAFENPSRIFLSRLIMYFFAAALVATGVGYWGLRHWREFTSDPARRNR